MEDNKIYVLDKDEVLLAIFSEDEEQPIINPRVQETQNSEAIFTFSITIDNPKWAIVSNPENLYYVKDKVFSPNFEGSYTETISENDEKLISVKAYERQKLLERKYVKAWNSEDGFDKIDTFMVVVLSNGNLDLKNNGELVNSTHLAGTSGYVLDALLYGTGWTVDTCDVEGTYDLETDQVDIYNNILKVQEIWGGILVFDSVNKTVSHRDETKYLPYNGFEVRYKKNMQSLEKLYNNKIITKLCPLGESGLNIKSINNNSEWITDFSYTTSVLEGIENNADITDAVQLKKWGQRKLKDLCKPRKELTVNMALLYQVEGYELETISLNDVVLVINYQDIEGDNEELRVVGFEYGVWNYSDATVSLSDVTLDSTDIFKKTISATNSLNAGTVNSSRIIFFKDGKSMEETTKYITEVIEQNKTEMTKSDEEIRLSVEQTQTTINQLTEQVLNYQERIEELQVTIDGLTNNLTQSGGTNLLRNSVGAFGNEYWEGTIVQYYDTDVYRNNVSRSAIKLQNASIYQEVKNIKNGKYNISFNYERLSTTATVTVVINGTSYSLTGTGWQNFEKVINISDHNFKITFTTNSANSCLISDLLLVTGESKVQWSQNQNETDTDTVQIGKGIQVNSTSKNVYTRIDADGNRVYKLGTTETVMEATDKGVEAENLVVRDQTEISGLLIQEHGNQVFVNRI